MLEAASCTDGDVRLVGGGTKYEGRVELCLNGAWGRVCFDRYSNENAEVVCRQLGFPLLGEDNKCESGTTNLKQYRNYLKNLTNQFRNIEFSGRNF